MERGSISFILLLGLPFRLTLKMETGSDFPCCVDLSPRAVCSEIKRRHTRPAGRGDRSQAES